jgi:hypothetical protein
MQVLTEFLGTLPVLERTVLVLAVSIGIALLLEFVVLRIARELVSATGSEFDDIVLQELRWPIVLTAALGGVFVLTQTPDVGTDVLGKEQLTVFFGRPAASVIVLL